ncbi:uncharacterized protein YALI1_C24222g [Yarrowia lipolytica]|uniref:Uncharacterized protein n=1 Tax=Yarrowia lipolytica TaxID=4952 RepID=A0A1D8NBH8_YARLL|nr:hypothetical protein YALI1_C24222g [Yarrowia lipolytica]
MVTVTRSPAAIQIHRHPQWLLPPTNQQCSITNWVDRPTSSHHASLRASSWVVYTSVNPRLGGNQRFGGNQRLGSDSVVQLVILHLISNRYVAVISSRKVKLPSATSTMRPIPDRPESPSRLDVLVLFPSFKHKITDYL